MLRKLAIAISVLMHPLLMPTLLFALLFYYSPIVTEPISQGAALYVLLAIFITTFVLPMISMIALRLSSFVTSSKMAALTIAERKDRLLPFFFTSLFYAITTYMFFAKFRVNQSLVVILACTTLVIVLITLITLFFKVSAYAASAGTLIGFLLGLGFKYPQQILWPLLGMLILGGLSMSARLYLNQHGSVEVLTGFAVGLGSSLGAVLLFMA